MPTERKACAMSLSPNERRTLLNLWCRLVRADGVVDDAEVDRLSELFAELGEGAVSEEEINQWLEQGPPEPEGRLPQSCRDIFIEHAQVIMRADREVVPTESAMLRELLARHFEA